MFGLLGKAETPEARLRQQNLGDVLMGIGTGLSQADMGVPVNMAPAFQAMAQRQQRAERERMLNESGLLERFNPEQRAILAQMEPSAAQQIIAQTLFREPEQAPNLQTFSGPDGTVYQFNPRTGETKALTGAEVDQGAPPTKQVQLADGSEVLVQWNPETRVWDPAPLPQGGTGGAPPSDLSESEQKLTLFGNMMEETSPVLNQIEDRYDPANMSDAAARAVPIAGNYFQTQEGQVYSSAASAWAEGALRVSTGAAAQNDEIARMTKTYFAQPGDLPATVQFKKQMRAMFERSLALALGRVTSGETLSIDEVFAISDAITGPEPEGGPLPAMSVEDALRIANEPMSIGEQRRSNR